MTKEEFLNRMEQYGIVIDGYKYQIAVGKLIVDSYYLGIYQKENRWLVYKIGDRSLINYYYEGTDENEAFDRFYDMVISRLSQLGYISKSITKKVIQTPKNYVCDFLQKKYSISKIDAEDTWNYLMYDLHVLNEVKYFALNNKFVPEDDCYKVQGYSAQDVHELLGLNIFDSFIYLIKLEKDDISEYLTRLESAKND